METPSHFRLILKSSSFIDYQPGGRKKLDYQRSFLRMEKKGLDYQRTGKKGLDSQRIFFPVLMDKKGLNYQPKRK